MLCGGQGPTVMAVFARAKDPFLRSFLALSNGLSSHEYVQSVVSQSGSGAIPRLFSAFYGPITEAETCTATVSTEIGRLQRQHQWPGLKVIGKVERTRETAEKITLETAYYRPSSGLTPERFNEVVCQHWSVENRLHWRLDGVMNEDRDRTRTGDGAHNLPCCVTGSSTPRKKRNPKAPCAENSNVPDGMTGSYAGSWRRFEMRLPCMWHTPSQLP